MLCNRRPLPPLAPVTDVNGPGFGFWPRSGPGFGFWAAPRPGFWVLGLVPKPPQGAHGAEPQQHEPAGVQGAVRCWLGALTAASRCPLALPRSLLRPAPAHLTAVCGSAVPVSWSCGVLAVCALNKITRKVCAYCLLAFETPPALRHKSGAAAPHFIFGFSFYTSVITQDRTNALTTRTEPPKVLDGDLCVQPCVQLQCSS